MASDNGKSFLDKFAEVSAKVGNQVHLRSLRDAFATITPLYILAGIAVLLTTSCSLCSRSMRRALPTFRRGVRRLRWAPSTSLPLSWPD